MKISIIYYSKYGNGKRAVEHLQGVLNEKGHNAGLVPVAEMRPEALPKADLYVLSYPTQVGRVPGKMKKFVKKAKGLEGGKCAVITTHASDNFSVEKMEKLLNPKKTTKATDGIGLRVVKMKGPFEEGWEKKLESFAGEIVR